MSGAKAEGTGTVAVSIQYIEVAESDAEDAEKLEIPVEKTGNLPLATLSQFFPGASGLKFKNLETGKYRALGMDTGTKTIYAPPDGWGSRPYVAIIKAVVHPIKDQRPEKRRRLVERDEVDEVDQEEDEFDRHTSDMIVLNLPYSTGSDGLKRYFESFGEVVLAEAKTDFRTGQPKGYGFVHMKDYVAQQKILDQYEHTLDSRVCQVKLPNSQATNSSRIDMKGSAPTKMYVGRLPPSMDQETIKDFFDIEAKKIRPDCKVEQVLLPTPSRGFCFVMFNRSEVAAKLIRAGNFVINDHSVCVSAANPKDPSSYGQQQQQQTPSAYGPSNDYSYSYGYGGAPPPAPKRYAAPPAWNSGTTAASTGYHSAPPEPRPYLSSGRSGGAPQGGARGPYSQSQQVPPSDQVPPNADPEKFQAAWQAFWHTLNSDSGGSAGGRSSAGGEYGQQAWHAWQQQGYGDNSY